MRGTSAAGAALQAGERYKERERERVWDGVGAYGPVHCRSICDSRSIPDNRSMSHNRSVSNQRSNTANRSISANDAGQYTTVIKTKSINLGDARAEPPPHATTPEITSHHDGMQRVSDRDPLRSTQASISLLTQSLPLAPEASTA